MASEHPITKQGVQCSSFDDLRLDALRLDNPAFSDLVISREVQLSKKIRSAYALYRR